MKKGFISIRPDEFADLVHEECPDLDRAEIVEHILHARNEYKKGKRCDCGEELWVAGAALAGIACFKCITGQDVPDEDFEIEGCCEGKEQVISNE
ncbi:MAG: hypothetical protein QF473_03230 [Planctomycetota bacterium]|nr:hypothetical protein [Planctomycetota bacterium]